jgi:signal transduction histidine kinase
MANPLRLATYRRAGLAAGLVAVAAALAWMPVAQGAEQPRLVVVLYPEADNGSPGGILAEQGIRTTFASSPEPIEVLSEHLELSRFPDAAQQHELARFLKRKYSGRKVDLVLAGLGSGLRFALEYGEEIFPGVPIVLLAVDRQEVESRALPARVIGRPITMDLAASLALALQLHPHTQRVYVVAGQSKFDAFWEAKARQAFGALEEKVEIAYLTGLPPAELQAAASTLPPHSLIYYLHVLEDRERRIHVPAEVVAQIAKRASAPIYSHVDSYVGRGIVGGRVFSFEAAGREAAGVGLRVLAGESPQSIGIQPASQASTIFDWRQLRRWGIPEADLPPGSEVRYREATFWERYRWRLIAALAVCALQTVLIVGLIAQRWRRAKAELELRRSQDELRQLAAQILGAQETERRRIARDLHDDFGQDLALLSVELDLHRQRPPATPTENEERLGLMSARVKSLSSSIHDLSHQLHPMKLEQLGLVAALRGLCKELSHNQDLKIEFTHEGVLAAISPDIALSLYRVAQEALHNVLKHSGAAAAKVTLRGGGSGLRLEVRDAGAGFDSTAVAGKGLGLVSMRERLRLVGGDLVIESRPARGTRVAAFVPLCAAADANVESNPSRPER